MLLSDFLKIGMINDFRIQASVVLRMLAGFADQKGITHQQIADKTGIHRSNITRMLSCRFIPRFDLVVKIADAIGVYFVFEDRDGTSDMAAALKKALAELDQNENGDQKSPQN